MIEEPADSEFVNLCAAIGFIVIQWAQAEQALDMAVNLIYRGFGGKDIADTPEIPRPLKRKIKFIRRCLNQLEGLMQFKEAGLALMTKFGDLSEERHNYVHGAIASSPLADGSTNFIKLDAKGDIHVLTEFTFNPGDFPSLTRKLLDLAGETNALCRGLINEIERREKSQ